MGLNVEKIRKDFPILKKEIKGKSIIYFDNACMTLRPVQVVEKINEYYKDYPSCGERSFHKLGKRVDEEVDNARNIIKKFVNSKSTDEIVFTKNTTESINLLANSLNLESGDIVLGSDKEHNSNLLPWQQLLQKGVKYDYIESDSDNNFSIENFQNKINKSVKVVSIVHTSNLDGTTTPAKEIIKIAHDNGSLVILDCAQSMPHHEINAKKLDADFLCFSGHKMMGPSGTGVLYGKRHLLKKIKPFIVGGGTVVDTTDYEAKFEEPPHKFEAGLQNYAGIIGLGQAAKYLMKIGKDNVEKHEKMLNKKMTDELSDIVDILGPKEADKRSGIISFNVKGIDPHDIAMMMDETENICIRSGAHCVHSWFNRHNLKGSARASLYVYNTIDECEKFVESLKKAIDIIK